MPRKKKTEPEYRLRVFPAIDRRSGSPILVAAVETIKEFVNFNYELVIEDRWSENTLQLKILGLHTPASLMPGIGPARGIRIHPLAEGIVTVIVTKPDKGENRFELEVRKRSVSVRQFPEQPFLIFSTDPIPFQ